MRNLTVPSHPEALDATAMSMNMIINNNVKRTICYTMEDEGVANRLSHNLKDNMTHYFIHKSV